MFDLTSRVVKRHAQKRLAARGTFWHGTSSKYLRSILKQGLIPDPKEQQFEKPGGFHRSIQTFGGIYLSDNWMTAYGFASDARRKQGGNPIMVGVTYETRTPEALPDEDDLIPYVSFATGLGTVADLTDPSGRSFWGVLFHRNNLRKYSYPGELWPGDYPQILGLVETEDLSEPIQKFWDRVIRDYPALQQRIPQRPKLDLLIAEMFRADALTFLEQHVQEYSGRIEKDIHRWLQELEKFYPGDPQAQDKRRREYESALAQIKKQPFKGGFPRLVKAATEVSKALKELSNPPERDRYRHNIRVLSPITYGGKNRILLVVEMVERKSETSSYSFTDLVFQFVRDASLIRQFFDGFEKSMGANYRALDRQGNAFDYSVYPGTEWPEDLWGPEP